MAQLLLDYIFNLGHDDLSRHLQALITATESYSSITEHLCHFANDFYPNTLILPVYINE